MRETKLTLPELTEKKAKGERLAMVAVGEAMSAAWADRAGVDIIGVGDSLGMTLHAPKYVANHRRPNDYAYPRSA